MAVPAVAFTAAIRYWYVSPFVSPVSVYVRVAAGIVPPTWVQLGEPTARVRSIRYDAIGVAPFDTGAAQARTFCVLPGVTVNVVGAVGVVADVGVGKTTVTSAPDVGRAVANAVLMFADVKAVMANV